MKLKIAQVIGLNTDQKAAQVISVTREGNTFLAVLDLSSDDAFTKGRQALSELSDLFFEGEGTPAEKLNSTFEEAKSKFSSSSGWDLIIVSIWGKVLYLEGQGEVEAYLKRDNKISSLLSVGSPAQLISGFIGDGDRLFFATKSLTTFLGEDLEKTLSLPLENFEEEVESKIGASESENQSLAALAVEAQESAQITTLPEEKEAPLLNQEPSPDRRAQFAVLVGKVFNLIGKAKIYFPKSGRGRLILAIILLLIIAGGAGYKYKTGKDRQKNLQFTNILQQARDNLNAAKGLSSLNPAEAKAKLDTAGDGVDKALVLKPKNQDAQNLKKEIENESPSILQQSSISDFPEFLDMDLVKKNFHAARMSLSNGKLLLLDQDIKTLAVVDLSKKSNEILAGSQQLGDAAFASLNGGSAFVYSKDKGILKIDIQNSKISQVAKQDSEWGEIKDIYGFASNVYLLDATSKIWKYVPTQDGYSDKRAYLSKEVKADFEGVLRMQIESSVYVLKSGGEILRFTKGEKDNFFYEGLPGGVKEVKSIFVSSDTENLYVLDSGNSRVLILNKTGSYKGQITGNKFGAATDLAVDEVGKKVYLLDGSKIYSVDLK